MAMEKKEEEEKLCGTDPPTRGSASSSHSLRGAKTSGKRDMWRREGRQRRRPDRRKRERERERNSLPTFLLAEVTISSHLSALLGKANLKETCSIRRPTCLKKSHVFSLSASARPCSLAFIFSRTIFFSHPPYLVLSLSHLSFLNHLPFRPPVALSFHPQSARTALMTHPLQTRPSLGFVDLPRGRRYQRIVKVSSPGAGYIGRNHDGRPSSFDLS